ncbi:hypothetical protein [Loigolactobacillus jiayinensis]|uniref:Uncharacterized protein n=1 Tax=Loigolactobacillus jiayinensis TaxID=2486016 RepID=A0ABW1RIR4_9LACO|nr:hypothetical protein [Loigolactobacillus jiayinensis]
MKTKWKIALVTSVGLIILLGFLAALQIAWAITILGMVTTLLLASIVLAIISYVFGVIESNIRRN